MPVAPFYIQPYDYGPHAARMHALLQRQGDIRAQEALQRAQIGANVTQSLADLVGRTVLGIAQQREAEAQRQREEQRYQDLLTRQNRLLELQELQAQRQGEVHAQQMREVERAQQLRELTGQLLAEDSIRVKGPQGVLTIDEGRVSEWLKQHGKEAFAGDVLPTVRAFNQSVLTATSSRQALEQATLQGLGVLSRVVAAGGYTPEALERAKELAVNAGLMTEDEYQQFIGQKVGARGGTLTPQQIKTVVDPFIELTMTEAERKAQRGEWITPGGGMAFYAVGGDVKRVVHAPKTEAQGDRVKPSDLLNSIEQELRDIERDQSRELADLYAQPPRYEMAETEELALERKKRAEQEITQRFERRKARAIERFRNRWQREGFDLRQVPTHLQPITKDAVAMRAPASASVTATGTVPTSPAGMKGARGAGDEMQRVLEMPPEEVRDYLTTLTDAQLDNLATRLVARASQGVMDDQFARAAQAVSQELRARAGRR